MSDERMKRRWMIGASLLGLCLVSLADPPKTLFEDRFEGKLDAGWSWLREHPGAWRFKDEALEIRVEPGVATTVRNALVRPAPDRQKGRIAIEVTVTFTAPPSNQYEQAGLTWYQQAKPVFKVVHELIDGKTYIIPGKKPTATNVMHLRLTLTADSYLAQFRPEGQTEFQTAASGPLAPSPEEQISIQCYNGPPQAEHWMRFDNFRILELTE